MDLVFRLLKTKHSKDRSFAVHRCNGTDLRFVRHPICPRFGAAIQHAVRQCLDLVVYSLYRPGFHLAYVDELGFGSHTSLVRFHFDPCYSGNCHGHGLGLSWRRCCCASVFGHGDSSVRSGIHSNRTIQYRSTLTSNVSGLSS